MIRTVVFGSLCLLAASAQATVVVDNFTDVLPAPSILTVTGSTFIDSAAQSGLPGVLGGNRTTSIEQQPPDQPSTGEATVSIENGMVGYSESPNIDAVVTLAYGGDLNPLNANFIGLSAFSLTLDSDFSIANSIRVAIDLTSGLGGTPVTGSLSYDLTSDPTDGIVRFNFVDFSGGVDFADVDQITLTLDSLSGAPDTVVSNFVAIPEPSAATLTAMSLALLGIRRSRRAQAA